MFLDHIVLDTSNVMGDSFICIDMTKEHMQFSNWGCETMTNTTKRVLVGAALAAEIAALILSPSNSIAAESATAVATAPDTQGATPQDNPPSKEQQIESISVTAAKLRSLEQFTPTGSRLGLSAKETPATIDVIDSDEMLGRGYISVEDAVDSLPGVTSGGSPGDMSQLSMRGFTGDQITTLHNGLYIGPADMTNRPQNVFNLQSVELLKGPASVLYGQGAIGGVINVVNKGPSFATPSTDVLAAIGNFGTTNIGFGESTHWGDALAMRIDVSRTATDGYVKRSPSDSFDATVSFLWNLSATLHMQLSVDFLEDHPSAYYGTPLVPVSFATQPLNGVVDPSSGVTIDQRMRYVNYNVGNNEIHSSQSWPQLLTKWTPTENLTIQNFAYYFHANRQWINSETYSFDTTTQLIDRDRFYVFHQQNLFGDQGSATYKTTLFDLPNSVVGGFDYSHLNFLRTRGFPNGDSVDPFNPSPGLFGPLLQPGDIVSRQSPTHWNQYSIFFEDALDLTPKLKLVTGGRTEQLDLDRQNFNTQGAELSSGFTNTYRSTNWRVGAVYKASDEVTPYVSWNTGKDPPGTNNILLINAAESTFALSSSEQFEAGVKANTSDHRADLTVAIYDITRKNILSVNPITGSELGSGEQYSRGFEASGNVAATRQWTVSANAAFTDAYYGHFFDTITGSTVDDIGHQPANIPKWTANIWTSFRDIGGLPLEIGGGVRYVGERYANTANSIRLDSYDLVNVYASYQLTPNILVIGRVNNVLDKAYAQWADVYYPSEIILAAPRTYQIGFIGKF